MIKLNNLFILAILNISLISSVLITHEDENLTSKILDSFKNSSKKDLFKAYHFLFKKNYDLKSEEGINRYKIFKQNLKYIEETNSKDLSYKLGINKFSDITNEEFRQKIESQYIPEVDNMEFDYQEELTSSGFLPQQTNINWLNYMNLAPDQGISGSCWAFSAIGALEGNYNVKYNQNYQFSQQQLVDCDTANKGCLGGNPKSALYTIARNGIGFLSDYAYTGLQSATCNTSGMSNYMVEGVINCSPGSCTRSGILKLVANGPVSTTMDAGSIEFQSYASGILKNITCTYRNHAVLIVGYYKDDTNEYYIVRNSWSTDWGEQGNYRIAVNNVDQTCFHEYQGYQPKLYQITTSTPKACIRLYPSCSFSGTPYEVCDNSATLAGYSGLVSSFSNIYSESVMFFSGGNCTGNIYVFNSDSACLSLSTISASMVNNVKSVAFTKRDIPTAGCIKVYDESCHSGAIKNEICDSVPDLSISGWARKISSIKLNKVGFISVTVYTGANYTLSSSTLSSDRYSMTSTFEKKIMSIRFNR
jgi:C1A family cysteine protease